MVSQLYGHEDAANRATQTSLAVEVGHINIYWIYGECKNTGPSPASNATLGHSWRRPMTQQLERFRAVGGPDACFDTIAAYTWLNDPVTKAQLHVAPALTWILCSNNITYTSTQTDESKVIYPTLVEKANLKVLIYNGA